MSRYCMENDCKKRASFGEPDDKQGSWCVDHKGEFDIDVVSKKCEHAGCYTLASYGHPDRRIREYCKFHKLDNYIPVNGTKCQHENCTTRASWGNPETKIKMWCKYHKLDTDIGLGRRLCTHKNCTIQCSFGDPDNENSVPEFCKRHKPDHYINVTTKICQYKNCKKRSRFGDPNDKNKIVKFCPDHKPDHYIDVASKFCIHKNCTILASYNYPGYFREYCFTHKTKRMIIHPSSKPKEQDVNCSYCCRPIHYNEEYCSGCKRYIELGNITIKTHEKELDIKNLLERQEIKFVHDKIVDTMCSKRRPDFRIPYKYGNIILEIDEFQHKKKDYQHECEITRMKQLYYDCGSEYLLFIRYNPDTYIKGDETVFTKRQREGFLMSFLKSALEQKTPPEPGLEVSYLFYDYFLPNDVETSRIEVI